MPDTHEAAEAVEELLPQMRRDRVIVTSRLSDWSGSVDPFELELLSEVTAVEFLLERTKNRRVNDASDCNKARELAKELDGPGLRLTSETRPPQGAILPCSVIAALLRTQRRHEFLESSPVSRLR